MVREVRGPKQACRGTSWDPSACTAPGRSGTEQDRTTAGTAQLWVIIRHRRKQPRVKRTETVASVNG